MKTEKRKFVRYPCNDKCLIKRFAPEGNNLTSNPIYLRDLSDGGVSGTYFGEEIPSYEEIHYLQDKKGEIKPVRLVWAFQGVSSVFMLGFKYENSASSVSHLD